VSGSIKLFLQDCVNELVAKALTAKAEKESTKSEYDLGKLLAFHDVITTLQQQALAFDIPLDEIGLNDINPDADLL